MGQFQLFRSNRQLFSQFPNCNPYFCFLHLWFSKALVRRQNSKFHINNFSYPHMIIINKLYVFQIKNFLCVRVLFFNFFFCRMIAYYWKRLHRSLWNFEHTFEYSFLGTLLILAMIWWKLSFLSSIVFMPNLYKT